MAVSFTPEQKKVIKLHNRNILVSAAAGSGKTAVLVERIIRMITEGEKPVDIDRLLVVTFTNAAAAEMRERISQAIDKKLLTDPLNVHLQKQASLLHNAQITTIDSFCLFVIRNNFNDIGLDPGFRVADEGELSLLSQDVLAQLLEEQYQEQSEGFTDCVEYFTGGSNDRLLEEYIQKLYSFSMSNPWPEDWISSCMEDYKITDEIQLENTVWCKYLTGYIRTMAEECISKLDFALRIAERPDGPYMYGQLLEQEKEMLKGLLKEESLAFYHGAFDKISFGRLPSKKDDSVNPLCREKVQQLRKEVKKQLEDIKETYLLLSPAQVTERMQKAAPHVETLLELVLSYKEKLDLRKRKDNIIDFHDMEHFALNILLKKQEDGSIVPSPAALEYRGFFEEILIDEYQDSNLVQELLLKSISGEDEGRYNRFMVGDVKQSIYKFRMARPELFMEKYDSYSKEDADCQRIDLHKNFRSRPQVLASVNELFKKIMGKKLGGVEYDEEAALYPGAVFPEYSENDTEYLFAEKDETSSLSVREQEAAMIAGRIKQLHRSFQVTDKETGMLRPADYRDMVILLRTTSGWAEDFKTILEREGIPAYVTSRTGYFQAGEVKVLLGLLHVIDNPLQDIPLYGSLRSVFGGFSEEEIAEIRAGNKKKSLYETMLSYEGPLQPKIQKFTDWLIRLRRKSAYTPIHKLIQEILTQTGYLDYVTAKPGGEQRRANVEMLLVRAAAFENTSYYGLFHFLRYIEQLEKYEIDYGEADVMDENADVVRIMSIHKSKGLEFPICFVAGLSKRFNMQDLSGRLIADADLGIGTDYVDSSLRLQSKTLKKSATALKMRMDALGEEMRVLYVAMTRAKEKLIMTAMVSDIQKLEAGLEEREIFAWEENAQEKTGFSVLAGASSYIDFILPNIKEAVLISPDELFAEDTREILQSLKQRQRLLTAATGRETEYQGGETEGIQEGTGYPEQEICEKQKAQSKIMKELSNKFGRQYEHGYLSQLYIKTTVSEIKKKSMQAGTAEEASGKIGVLSGGGMAASGEAAFTKSLYEEEEVVPYIPSFIREKEELSGTDRGSAYHKVMELLDFGAVLTAVQETMTKETEEAVARQAAKDVSEEAQRNIVQATSGTEAERRIHSEIDRQLQLFTDREVLSSQWKAGVRSDKIAAFFQTELAKRMTAADRCSKLFKEQPFVLSLPASRLSPEFPDTEKVLIQGIIDVYFEEDGKIIIADYKTDAVKEPEELIRRYQVQLDYYAEALERLTGKEVSQKIIYSFALAQEIVVY